MEKVFKNTMVFFDRKYYYKKILGDSKKFMEIPMRLGKYTIFFVLIIGSLSLLWSQEKISPNYKVGPQDMIEITVFGHDEFNRSVRVSEEGKITFPYIGEIEINGLTMLEIENKLKSAIEKVLLVDATVIIFIKEFHSQKVSLFGAVEKQGQYQLEGPETLLSLLSKAGGITESAGKEIIVIRQLPDKTTRSLRIPIHDLLMNGDPSLDIPLQANDKINVPIDELVKIYFVGEVINPGVLEVKSSKMPMLHQAIIQVGGFTPKAAQKRVMIKRLGPDGKEQTFTYNVRAILKGRKNDVLLKENDTVYIPETIF